MSAWAEALLGRTFVSESVTEGGEPRPLVEGTQVRLRFHEDERLTAHAGCNSLGAAVQVTADRLMVADLSTTEIGCQPELHEQDRWLSDLLAAGPAGRRPHLPARR